MASYVCKIRTSVRQDVRDVFLFEVDDSQIGNKVRSELTNGGLRHFGLMFCKFQAAILLVLKVCFNVESGYIFAFISPISNTLSSMTMTRLFVV